MDRSETPVDVAVKHVVARATKQFFGYGPAGRVFTAIQGDLVVFSTEFHGPGILAALPQRPFGRIAMRYIADLFREQVTPEFARLAREQFGVGLEAVLSDLDYETGQSLGIALLDRPLPPLDQPADLDLTLAIRTALAASVHGTPNAHLWLGSTDPADLAAATVRIGPAALVVRCNAGLEPPAQTPEAELSTLLVREALRARLRSGIIAALAAVGRQSRAVFVAKEATSLVAGALLLA